MSDRSSTQSRPDFRLRMVRGPMMVSRIERARAPQKVVRRLVPYLGNHRWLLMGVLFLTLFATLCGLVAPYLIGLTIDELIHTRSLERLPSLSLWMLAVFLLGNLTEGVSA